MNVVGAIVSHQQLSKVSCHSGTVALQLGSDLKEPGLEGRVELGVWRGLDNVPQVPDLDATHDGLLLVKVSFGLHKGS